MMNLDDMPEMIAAWESGNLLEQEVYMLCVDLFARFEVEDVLARLPPSLRAELDATLKAEFDNEIPAADYLFFDSARGDNPDKVVIIERIRAYFGRRAQRRE